MAKDKTPETDDKLDPGPLPSTPVPSSTAAPGPDEAFAAAQYAAGGGLLHVDLKTFLATAPDKKKPDQLAGFGCWAKAAHAGKKYTVPQWKDLLTAFSKSPV